MPRFAKSLLVAALMVCSGATYAQHPRDPYEGFNRKVFWFNERVDKIVLKPIAKRYVKWTPAPIRTGVNNFFGNLGEIGNATNNLLQGKPKQAVGDVGRFVINSTVGFFGVLDTASRFGINKSEEDLGQTLAKWGMASGPYVMVPFLGPRTLRDAVAYYPDTLSDASQLLDDRLYYGLLFGEIIDLRANLLATERMIAGDRYAFIRDAYLQRRDFLIRDGELADDAFEDDFEDDFFD